MGTLTLLTYLYEIPLGACLGYLILQTLCLILQISSPSAIQGRRRQVFGSFRQPVRRYAALNSGPTMRDVLGQSIMFLNKFNPKNKQNYPLDNASSTWLLAAQSVQDAAFRP
jgi:hypothetical protein